MLRVFCEAGGVSYEEARSVGEDRRYATFGALAILTGVMAAFSSAATMHQQLHLPWPIIAVISTIIGLMVYGIDRLFVLVPLARDTWRYRLRMVLTRGLVSLVLGLFISHGLVMYAFNKDLTARVERAAGVAADEAEAEVRRLATEPGDIDELTDQNESLRGDITRTQNIASKKKKEWRDNTVCVNGTVFAADGDFCGDGNASPGLKSDWEQYQNTVAATTLTENTTAINDNDVTIQTLRDQLQQKVDHARAAALENTGVAEKTNALIDLLRQDLFLLFLPLLFLVLDLSVVLTKAMLPTSKLDRRAMLELATHEALMADVATAPEMVEARRELARIEATRLVREARSRELRAEARDRRDTEGYLARQERTPSGARRRVAWVAGVTALALLVAGAAFAVLQHDSGPTEGATGARPTAEPSGDGATRVAAAADTDRTLDLGYGVRLDLPRGAISKNAEVTVTPAKVGTLQGRSGYDAVTPAFDIKTAGEVVGKGGAAPKLVLDVPSPLREKARSGSLSVAFHSDEGWEQVKGRYNAKENTFAVAMPHFSWWQFWDWDWTAIGAGISQHTLSLIGMRSNESPRCDNGVSTPSWFNQAVGVANENGLVIRSCVQGSADHDGVLDVQIVNNRPIGMILDYNGANVQWGWHQDPDTIVEALSYAAGDAAASAADGLYLPPLGRASVGIFNPGDGQSHPYFIGQTWATLASDIFTAVGDAGLAKVAEKAVALGTYKAYRDAFRALMDGACAKMLTPVSMKIEKGIADNLLESVLSGDLADCLAQVTVVAGRNALASGADLAALNKFSETITNFRNLARAGVLFTIGQGIATVGDLWVDSLFAVGEQGYGFTVWAKSSLTPSDPPTSTPPTAQPPSSPPASQSPSSPPTSPPPSTQPPTVGQPVKLYDNYGTVITAGTPMCAGNPGRPESMPGGTVAQTFTATRSAVISSALVQIDPSPALTVTASVKINGTTAAGTTAVPVGDTTFTFSPIAVRAGDTVTLMLTWSGSPISGSNPKLDTIYTVGNPGGSLSVRNSCSDGAPTYDTTSTGLRAVISGTTS